MLPVANPNSLFNSNPAFNAAQLQYAATAQGFNADPNALGANMTMGRLPGSDSFGSAAFPYLQPPPVSNFMGSLEVLVTEDLPKVDALARTAIDGISRSYNPQVDPNHTAPLTASTVTLIALRDSLQALYNTLRDTGLGAIPLNPTDGAELLNTVGANPDPRVEALTEQVNAMFKEGKNARERATASLDVLKTSNT